MFTEYSPVCAETPEFRYKSHKMAINNCYFDKFSHFKCGYLSRTISFLKKKSIIKIYLIQSIIKPSLDIFHAARICQLILTCGIRLTYKTSKGTLLSWLELGKDWSHWRRTCFYSWRWKHGIRHSIGQCFKLCSE